MKKTSPFLQNFLEQNACNEWNDIFSLIAAIEALQKEVEKADPAKWQAGLENITPYRIRYSSTLLRGEIESWKQANDWISQKALTKNCPEWEDVEQINRILNPPNGNSVVRSHEVFLGPWKTCPALELMESIAYIQTQILQNKDLKPLIKAALAQYWILSIHPFSNANGRTAVLVADWILTSHGYLPQCFKNKLDGVVAFLADRKTKADSRRAILKILNNVKFSYEVFLNVSAEEPIPNT